MDIVEGETTLIRALRAAGGWATRKQLAELLNKNDLRPEDFLILDLMYHRGKIERQLVPGNAHNAKHNVKRWEYRLKAK